MNKVVINKFFKVFNANGQVMNIQGFPVDSPITAETLAARVANLGGRVVEVTDDYEKAMLRDSLAQQK